MSEQITRRDVIKWFSAGAGAATVGGAAWVATRPGGDGGSAATDSTGAPRRESDKQSTAEPNPSASVDAGQRLLVVIDMPGGNDGMSTIVPHGLGAYYDLRPNTAVGEDRVIDIDGEVGWHANLGRLAKRPAAIVHGVGSSKPDGSHFEMQARWWEGSPERTGVFDTGFIGRLADAIGNPDAPATALAIADGGHPALISSTAATMTIRDGSAAGYLSGAAEDDDYLRRFQAAYRMLGTGRATPWEARRADVRRRAIGFTDAVGTFEQESPYEYRDDRLGSGLRLAAHLFGMELGVRVVFVSMEGDFDTHDGHNYKHDQNMSALDESLDAFLTDVGDRGLADRVIVATTSEFGRTARDNDSGGLDHGSANTLLMFGAVNPGRYGEMPVMEPDDEAGGFAPTVGFQHYLATLGSALGADPNSLVEGDVELIDGIVG